MENAPAIVRWWAFSFQRLVKEAGDQQERRSVGKRVRDVAVAPDGALWIAEDSPIGGLYRVTPK
ncbi:hypothetical protein AYO42_04600 [Rhizomicrobium sp. SCGC AG-212-E05]|nr:hypothetical protein AYO42_04600 [Rhizomicrobium sp. SCGC AG-212-E05]